MLAYNEQNCEHDITLASTEHDEIQPRNCCSCFDSVWWRKSPSVGSIKVNEPLLEISLGSREVYDSQSAVNNKHALQGDSLKLLSSLQLLSSTG